MRFILLISLLSLFTIDHISAQQDSTRAIQPEEKPKGEERMPSFPGGVEEMYRFIYSEMRYPAEAKKFGVSGQVITQCVINAEGKMEDITLVKGIGYGCDEEAIRVVTLMQEKYTWIPGLHNGQPVPVKYTLPLKFVIR